MLFYRKFVVQHLVTNESQLDAVTEAVAAQHSKLLGFPQPVAECWYIVEAQHLDGYGQERFLAKVFTPIFKFTEWRFECMLYKLSSFFIFSKNQRARLW